MIIYQYIYGMDISTDLPRRHATHTDDELTKNIGDYTVTISPEISHGAYR